MRTHRKPVKVAILLHGQGLEPAKGIGTLKGAGLERIIGITNRQTRSVLGEELFDKVTNSGKDERTADTRLNQLAAAYEGITLARAFLHAKPAEGAPSVAELYYGNQLDIAVAGHSVGEIVAASLEPLLSLQGRVTDSGRYKKGLTVLKERGQIMFEHYMANPGAHRMGVVIGKSDEFCAALVGLAEAEHGRGSVSVAGHNSPTIHTLAGKADAVSYAIEHAKSSGATTVDTLNDYGFHDYETMHECAMELKAFLKAHKELKFSSHFPVVSSRNGKTLKRARALRADFSSGVEEPVMWHCCGSDEKHPGKGFVIDTLIREGYAVHVVFARELKGWERELEKERRATVIAITDYASLVAGCSKIAQLVRENSSSHYQVLAPAQAMQSAPSPQL